MAIVARGVVGESVGELSLLFRWFYIEAASRIALDHPLLGVGPGGFKDAYAVAKNPISPENAASPHSVLFDAAATMGLAVGAGVLALVVLAAQRAAGGLLRAAPAEEQAATFPRLALVAGPALAVVIGVRFELQSVGGLTLALALAWVLGLAGWVALAWAMRRGPSGQAVLGAAAAALVLIAHGQIEMTPVLIGSASLWAAWLGVAVSFSVARGEAKIAEPSPEPPRLPARLLGAVPALLALAVAWLALPGLWVWQNALTEAASLAREPAAYRMRLEVSGGDPRVFRAVADDLSEAIDQRVGAGNLAEGLRMLADRSARSAAEMTDRAVDAAPVDGPTLRTASRAWLVVALSGDPQAATRAEALARRATETTSAAGQNFSHLATVIQTLDRPGDRRAEVLEALARAEALNPASPHLKHRQFVIARDAGLDEWARRSAESALQADERMRLDRLGAGLSEAQRAEIEAYLAGG